MFNFAISGGVESAISTFIDAKLTAIFIGFRVTILMYHASFTPVPKYGDTSLFPENCGMYRSAIYLLEEARCAIEVQLLDAT